jgi:hypothetical protein
VKDETVGRGIHDFVLNVVFPTLNDIPSSRKRGEKQIPAVRTSFAGFRSFSICTRR